MNISAIIQLLTLFEAIAQKGKSAYDAVKAAAQAQGVEGDWTALDEVIADAARRKAIAEADANPIAPDSPNTPAT